MISKLIVPFVTSTDSHLLPYLFAEGSVTCFLTYLTDHLPDENIIKFFSCSRILSFLSPKKKEITALKAAILSFLKSRPY